ncbi:hypothetical protein DL764_005960 [Monosporascus ibericus]|uniref:Uncharacterized protein n=1 Tax=Monosporascus ibericus TaxID=155417 RepID=A0A4Q4T6S0_9PEZI|nr:hypothetical protein DL764_005960 [Monosporascus ibericus]
MPSTTSSTTSTARPYLLRDEFIDSRNAQDRHLNDEFHSIRRSIDEVRHEFKDDVKKFKDEVKENFNAVDARFNTVDARFDRLEFDYQQIKVGSLQTTAYLRNFTLHNPILPIQPVVTFRPTEGILEPDHSLFPRHANEFYSLKALTTSRQRRMLAYLANFYDILSDHHHHSSDDNNSEDKDILIKDPGATMELLKAILGLQKDNFITFRKKAHRSASQPRQPPIKRSQLSSQNDTRDIRRIRLEVNSKRKPNDTSDGINISRLS